MSAITPAATQQPPRLAPSEHRQAAEMLASAFYDDPLSIYLAPDEEKRARTLPWLYERIIKYAFLYDGHLLTAGDSLPPTPSTAGSPLPQGEGPGVREEDGVHGLAVWLPPGRSYTPMPQLIRAGLALAPLKFGIGTIGRFMAANTVEHLRAKLAPEPHWYLWVIGVKPDRQGHGVGSSLIAPMLARADADALPCYLETHKERNVRFYQKHGFNVVHSGNVPKGGPAYWCLKRDARR